MAKIKEEINPRSSALDIRGPEVQLLKPEIDSAKTESKNKSSGPPSQQSESEGIMHQMTDLNLAKGISFPGPDHPLYDPQKEHSSDASSQHRMRLTNTGEVEIANLLSPLNAVELSA